MTAAYAVIPSGARDLAHRTASGMRESLAPLGMTSGAVETRHARLHLRHLRHAVPRCPAPAGAVPDLHRGTPVHRLGRPAVDHARRAPPGPPQPPGPRRPRPARHRHRAEVRDRPAGAVPAGPAAAASCGTASASWTTRPSRPLQALGGVAGIAISHPHFYSSMVEWSRALGGVPVYLHADDSQWVVRHDRAIVFWDGDTREVAPGLTLIHCGGHFAGSTVLHWADGADGGGALLTGDTIMVGEDRRTRGIHVQLPQLHPAQRPRGRADRSERGAVRVRSHLRRLVRPEHPVGGKQARPLLGRAATFTPSPIVDSPDDERAPAWRRRRARGGPAPCPRRATPGRSRRATRRRPGRAGPADPDHAGTASHAETASRSSACASGSGSMTGRPFPFQEEAWRAYLAGESGLIHAATGTGKTYAAWIGPVLEWLRDYPGRAAAKGRGAAAPRPLDHSAPRARGRHRGGSPRAASRTWASRGPSSPAPATPRPASAPANGTASRPRSSPRPRACRCCSRATTRRELFDHLELVVVDEWHELLGIEARRADRARPGPPPAVPAGAPDARALRHARQSRRRARRAAGPGRRRRAAARPHRARPRSQGARRSTRSSPRRWSASRGPGRSACGCCPRSSPPSRRARPRSSSRTPAPRPRSGTRRCSPRGPTGPGSWRCTTARSTGRPANGSRTGFATASSAAWSARRPSTSAWTSRRWIGCSRSEAPRAWAG